MENHPFLWRWIRRVRRIQVCMARKGLIPPLFLKLINRKELYKLTALVYLASQNFSALFFKPLLYWHLFATAQCIKKEDIILDKHGEYNTITQLMQL